MQVHRDIHHLPEFQNAAITIGTFDGVHKGHVKVIEQLKKEALDNNGQSVLITFHPHPRRVLRTGAGQEPKSPVYLLNTLEEKIELLAGHSIDHLVVVPFTLEFSNLTAEEYISDFLVKKFKPKTIITGYDHRFGKGRLGDYKLLESFRDQYHYEVKEIPAQVLHHITVSSTKIRHSILEGDVKTANENLGYDYFFSGKVIDGNKLGRTLGYPTANILVEDTDKIIPGFGIYAVTTVLDKTPSEGVPDFRDQPVYRGMMSIGIRPTIGDNKIMTEVNLFDFNQEIYGRELRVSVKKYLRDEIRFEDLEALKKQIASDEIEAKKILDLT